MENWVVVLLTFLQSLKHWPVWREEKKDEEKYPFSWNCHKLASPFKACQLSKVGSSSLGVLSLAIYKFPARHPGSVLVPK